MADSIIKNRFDYIDIAKAIGMLTIMWGHIATGNSVSFVYAFHIPLFFFLSGMVFVDNKS
jgi:fucose 4-O-acetylase-like acetyltransferase